MTDQYLTRDKTLEVTCVGHASIMMRYGEQIIHVDPAEFNLQMQQNSD